MDAALIVSVLGSGIIFLVLTETVNIFVNKQVDEMTRFRNNLFDVLGEIEKNLRRLSDAIIQDDVCRECGRVIDRGATEDDEDCSAGDAKLLEAARCADEMEGHAPS